MNIGFVIDFVKDACEKPENVFTKSFFKEHLTVVNDYSEKLARILKADKEVVKFSAYLHDISAVLDASTISEHNIKSADVARTILAENKYPAEKIEKIVKCILNHNKPLKIGAGSIEEVCVSNADAMSQIINPSYWLYFAYKIKGLNFDEGKSWYINKIDSNWKKLIEAAKIMVKEEYQEIRSRIVSY